MVFLDLKKAFDTIDHKILLQKLNKYGLGIRALGWFTDYLTHRYQCTRVNYKTSETRLIKCGVPQGSILGPLLFILYINDLEHYLEGSRINLYVDDTALSVCSESFIDLILLLRQELFTVEQWLLANKLTLNASKTKYMLFGTKHKLNNIPNFNLYMGGELLERVESFKYLGVKLDQHLTFQDHIDWVYRKSSMKLGAIRKIRKNLTQPIALSLYKSLVLPHLDYCDIVFDCASKEHLNRLQIFQNSACRTILLADSDTHISDMHNQLGLLYLQNRRDLHLAVTCHKSIYFNGLSSLSEFYIPVVSVTGRSTRQTDTVCMRVPRMRTKIGQQAISYRGPKHWNRLPADLRIISNFTMFKRLLSLKISELFENHPT